MQKTAYEMRISYGSSDVCSSDLPDSVEQACPHATDRLVLFVPDGDDDESCWAEHLDQVGGTYPSRLASLLDWTPVHMLVAPGPRPAELAVDVVSSVQALVGAWPVDVRRIALVGHGSGGLVLRAAVAVEAFGGESWLDLVSDMVLLGTPHLAVPASGPTLSRRVEEERSEEHTSELQSLMRISSDVFCLKKQK